METLVVVPVYNEAESLEWLLSRLPQGRCLSYVVIDDGSNDNSSKIAENMGFEVVVQPINMGKSQAVKKGFDLFLESGNEAVVILDGDGQHPPESLPAMLHQLESYPLVKGSRFHQGSGKIGEIPDDRLVLCGAVAGAMRQLVGWELTDPQCGFVGIQRKFCEHLYPWLDFDLHGLEIQISLVGWWLLAGLGIEVPKEIPIPAVYELPSQKQRDKYQPSAWQDRLRERLFAQVYKVMETWLRCQEIPQLTVL